MTLKNNQLITRLYTALQQLDHQAMAECYHPEATFKDEVFDLEGKEIAAMWHMLCERGTDLEITWSDIHAGDQEGSAHLEADYTFSQTGRKVHNSIDASFRFKDGKIIQHHDRFNFWRWSGMALGMTGWLLGWTPFLQKKVSANARKGLDRFIAGHPEYQ